jgi:hypothetical protein
MAPDAIVALAQGTAGGIAVMAFFLYLFIVGWIVPKPTHEYTKEQVEYWKATTKQLLSVIERFAPTEKSERRNHD